MNTLTTIVLSIIMTMPTAAITQQQSTVTASSPQIVSIQCNTCSSGSSNPWWGWIGHFFG
jgi:hypothetical protein